MNIEREGRNALVKNESIVFSYEVMEDPRDFSNTRKDEDSLDWGGKEYFIGNWKVFPYGDMDDIPEVIRQAVQRDSDAPGVLTKKSEMLWGKGPKIYEELIEEGDLIRKWTEDKDIQSWLDSWDYEDYLLKATIDVNHIKGHFTKFHLSKGGRIGSPKIRKLEHLNPNKCRGAAPKESKAKVPTHFMETDYALGSLNEFLSSKVYLKYNPFDPFTARTTIMYSNTYSFCSDFYTMPDLYGALEWLKRSTAIPLILKNLALNSISAKYHVQSPQKFWSDKRKTMKEECDEKNETYDEQMLLDYEDSLMKMMAKVLANEKNVGKFWHTKRSLEVDGTNLLEHGWTIEPIKDNMMAFIKAHILISDHSSQKVNASIGVHSSIGNNGKEGKVDGGGEQYYALSNFLQTGVDVPESIIMKPINSALKANFPKTKKRIGFYHQPYRRLSEITPKERP